MISTAEFFINEQCIFKTQTQNLGQVNHYGLQVKGSLKFHKMITVNPYLKFSTFTAKQMGWHRKLTQKI